MIDDRRVGGSGEPDMSPLFMDTGCEANSPGSPSAEECHSTTPVSEERDSERQQVGSRGSKRRDKNRDAARKSRKKQTERADELHEVVLEEPSLP
ncbi:basic leucine zipper transcriptional factor ATF-like 3 isoform X2 [Acanthochromis polyacanthus]|uniref:basic leucine zipper transcriptional factor ATF-like 3 isoform X2 n=1 Tax=Acanthochromis polyacanthus TaxID=80966 RepID=UPI0022343247|nr:basic leucine zipper transcriptional factor ATF-like 3 isoform X2 [Acanthochromis polyacanthus]